MVIDCNGQTNISFQPVHWTSLTGQMDQVNLDGVICPLIKDQLVQ